MKMELRPKEFRNYRDKIIIKKKKCWRVGTKHRIMREERKKKRKFFCNNKPKFQSGRLQPKK